MAGCPTATTDLCVALQQNNFAMPDPTDHLLPDSDDAPDAEPTPRQRRQTYLVYGLMVALGAIALAWVLWRHTQVP